MALSTLTSSVSIGLEMILFFYEFRFRENYQFKQEVMHSTYNLGSIDEVSNFEQHLVGPLKIVQPLNTRNEKVDLITKNTFDKIKADRYIHGAQINQVINLNKLFIITHMIMISDQIKIFRFIAGMNFIVHRLTKHKFQFYWEQIEQSNGMLF